MSEHPFVKTDRVSSAIENPLLPAQAALAFVLEPETWPVFRAWLEKNSKPGDSTEAEDRDDVKRAFGLVIQLSEMLG